MKFKLLLIITLIFTSLTSFAGVNLKNGNFYKSFNSIVVPGGKHSLELVWTYNSKSTDVGWLGFGIGTPFETHLKGLPDGSVVVFENGSGAKTRYTPKDGKLTADAAAKKVIDEIRKTTRMTEKVAQDKFNKLKNDPEMLTSYVKRFGIKTAHKKGTVLHSNKRGMQTVHKLKKGWKRVSQSGKIEFFNENGKLSKVLEKDGYEKKFVYKKGNLHSIKDSQAKQLFFSWYSDGKLKEVWSAGDKKATFKYDGQNLVEAKDVASNRYKFSYDRNHNMKGITYSDGSKMEIDYDRKTQFVSRVKTRGGAETKYLYGANSKNPDMHYWTEVKKKGLNGKWNTNRYEYEIRKKKDGERYTYRIATTVNKITTETIYSECCSLPVKISRGNSVTNFDYNKDGLLTRKWSAKEDVRIEYDKKIKKISKVTNNEGWTTFAYDKKGNLSKAVNSKGNAVLLVYNRKGRITKMVDQNLKSKKKQVLSFKYNSMGKPTEIKMDNLGKINVDYDNYGEIKKVNSKQGHKMALQVHKAFQSLLKIVKPAGVNLNM